MASLGQSALSPVKIVVYLAIIGAILYLLLRGDAPPQLQKVAGFTQGTSYHISWWSNPPVATATIEAEFDATLAQIDAELSTYRNDSYISKFNNSSSTDWQAASADFIQLIETAKEINHKTDGCYDPTIGPLFNLWGFQKDIFNLPTPEQIAQVKSEIGIDKVEVDKAQLQIRKTLPQLQLNFSSMGEGYTIDKLAKVLEQHHIQHYLVEFGGDMKIRGHKPDGSQWRIAIQRPENDDTNSRTPYAVVTINDQSGVTLDTSGTYRHHFDADGKQYSHILDPRTGYPVSHQLVSASVFGSNPSVGDAWATAMLCLGPKAGKTIAEREQLAVFFITEDNQAFSNSRSQPLQQSTRVTFTE